MKLRFVLIFILLSHLASAQVLTQFNGTVNVFGASGSAPNYTIQGFFNDPMGMYTSDSIAVGDVLFLLVDNTCARLRVDTINSATGGILNLDVTDIDNKFMSPPNGIGAVMRGTPQRDFPLYTPNLSETLLSCIRSHFTMQVDSLSGGDGNGIPGLLQTGDANVEANENSLNFDSLKQFSINQKVRFSDEYAILKDTVLGDSIAARFGSWIERRGDTTMYVGGEFSSLFGNQFGAFWVLRKRNNDWVVTQAVGPPSGVFSGRFGSRIAANADSLLLVSEWNNGSAGRIHAYVDDGATVSFRSTIIPVGSGIEDFGTAIAIFDTTAIVGASTANGVGTDAGMGFYYSYNRSTATWTQQQIIQDTSRGSFNYFGTNALLFNDTACIIHSSAWANIYKRTPTGLFVEFQEITSSNLQNSLTGTDFLSYKAPYLFIGSDGQDVGFTNNGRVRIVRDTGSLFFEDYQMLYATNQATNRGFGVDVSADNDLLAVSSTGNGSFFYLFKEKAGIYQPLQSQSAQFNAASDINLKGSDLFVATSGYSAGLSDRGILARYSIGASTTLENEIVLPAYKNVILGTDEFGNLAPKTSESDGNGIYSGSNTVPANTVASITDQLQIGDNQAKIIINTDSDFVEIIGAGAASLSSSTIAAISHTGGNNVEVTTNGVNITGTISITKPIQNDTVSEILVYNETTGTAQLRAVSTMGGGSGEVNTTSNLGDGVGLASTKVGVNLPFKSIKTDTSDLKITPTDTTINLEYVGESFIEVAMNGSGIIQDTIPFDGGTYDIQDDQITLQRSSGDFTNNQGIVTYTGSLTKVFKVTAILSGFNTCDDTVDFTYRLRENTSSLRHQRQSVSGDRPFSVSIQGTVQLTNGETVYTRIATNTGTNCTDWGISDYSLILEEIK